MKYTVWLYSDTENCIICGLLKKSWLRLLRNCSEQKSKWNFISDATGSSMNSLHRLLTHTEKSKL